MPKLKRRGTAVPSNDKLKLKDYEVHALFHPRQELVRKELKRLRPPSKDFLKGP